MAEGSRVVEEGGEKAVAIKHDWYQTESCVVVVILAKNVDKDGVTVQYSRKSLDVVMSLPGGGQYSLHVDLAHEIEPSKCTHKVLASKVELKLKKVDGLHWGKLEGVAEVPVAEGESQDGGPPRYPSSAPNARDWSRVVLDEAEGDAESEAALNELFRKIYVDGSDEVKRAMNKSFQESGGTVLSTNWNEVSRQKIDVKPPDGLEWRKWD